MDEIGSEIWNMLDKPTKVADIITDLSAIYDVDSEKCRDDVLEFLRELLQADLIELRD